METAPAPQLSNATASEVAQAVPAAEAAPLSPRKCPLAARCPRGYEFGMQLAEKVSREEAALRASRILWPRPHPGELRLVAGAFDVFADRDGKPKAKSLGYGWIVYRPRRGA